MIRPPTVHWSTQALLSIGMVTEGTYAAASRPMGAGDFWTLEFGSPEYPLKLLDLAHPPPRLYVAGSLSRLDDDAVAVVGSRVVNPAVAGAATAIGRAIAQQGWIVVSGLARGVDAAAHRGALMADGGRTIAVVATGLDRTYPPEHLELDRMIRSRGAVVSAYPMGRPPSRDSFLARNEIIAALARGTVIVTAEERSGTRSTINHTRSQGKPVLFWKPIMGDTVWARAMVAEGTARFVADVDEIVERFRGK